MYCTISINQCGNYLRLNVAHNFRVRDKGRMNLCTVNARKLWRTHLKDNDKVNDKVVQTAEKHR